MSHFSFISGFARAHQLIESTKPRRTGTCTVCTHDHYAIAAVLILGKEENSRRIGVGRPTQLAANENIHIFKQVVSIQIADIGVAIIGTYSSKYDRCCRYPVVCCCFWFRKYDVCVCVDVRFLFLVVSSVCACLVLALFSRQERGSLSPTLCLRSLFLNMFSSVSISNILYIQQ